LWRWRWRWWRRRADTHHRPVGNGHRNRADLRADHRPQPATDEHAGHRDGDRHPDGDENRDTGGDVDDDVCADGYTLLR
jgi:hypothetical protein